MLYIRTNIQNYAFYKKFITRYNNNKFLKLFNHKLYLIIVFQYIIYYIIKVGLKSCGCAK